MTIALNRHYIPVAGIGIIDAGGGCFLEMLDTEGFKRERGGSFHCWIESADLGATELIDFIFRHNAAYAKTQGIKWGKKKKSYLWGLKNEIHLNFDQSELPKEFPEGKVWFKKVDEGTEFITNHVASHIKEHAKITSIALKRLTLELETHLAKLEASRSRIVRTTETSLTAPASPPQPTPSTHGSARQK